MARRTARDDRPAVRCCRCGGAGRIPLTGVYLATYRLLARQVGPINAATLAALAGCAGTTMANRLVRLERLGLAVGEWNGRERLWEAVGEEARNGTA